MRKVMEVTAVLQYLAIGQSALTHQSNSFHDPTVTLFCWLHMSLKVPAVMLKLLIQVFGSLYRPNVSPLTICVVRPVLVTSNPRGVMSSFANVTSNKPWMSNGCSGRGGGCISCI